MVDTTMLTNLGLMDILLWMLAFAIIYGISSTAKIPKSQGARVLISISISLLVLFSGAGTVVGMISKLANETLLILIGLLVLIIFFEMTKLAQQVEYKTKGPKGEVTSPAHVSVWKAYQTLWLLAFLVLAILVFVSVGGLQFIGISGLFQNVNWIGVLFILIMIFLVGYAVVEKV